MKKIKFLKDYELEKFSRQIILQKIGEKGQLEIMNCPILVIGCGGLGTTAATYLSMSGVLNIGIVDHDKVSLSNLNRQLLFAERDVGKKKVCMLKEKLVSINPNVNLNLYDKKIDLKNGFKIIKNYKIVLDCTDNFKSRYIINHLCFKEKKILVSAALYNFEIQLLAFRPWLNVGYPCYNCIFPEQKRDVSFKNCNDQGIVSSVAGIGGLFQANMTLNILIDNDQKKFKELILFDCKNNNLKKIKTKKDLNCNVCKKQN